MNERLGLFCDRASPDCHLSTWSESDLDGERLFQVYCRGALEDPWPQRDGGVLDTATLSQRISTAGGGLIAMTAETGDTTGLQVDRVPGPDYEPATEMLLLTPDREPRLLAIGADRLSLEPGAFVLLPATRADQASLKGLLEHLGRLPGDYGSLLLQVLRRPGIESAMRRLEQRIDRLDTSSFRTVLSAGEGRTAAVHIGGRWPWLLAGLLVLNLAAVVGSALRAGHPQATAVPPAPPPCPRWSIPETLQWPQPSGHQDGAPFPIPFGPLAPIAPTVPAVTGGSQ